MDISVHSCEGHMAYVCELEPYCQSQLNENQTRNFQIMHTYNCRAASGLGSVTFIAMVVGLFLHLRQRKRIQKLERRINRQQDARHCCRVPLDSSISD